MYEFGMESVPPSLPRSSANSASQSCPSPLPERERGRVYGCWGVNLAWSCLSFRRMPHLGHFPISSLLLAHHAPLDSIVLTLILPTLTAQPLVQFQWEIHPRFPAWFRPSTPLTLLTLQILLTLESIALNPSLYSTQSLRLSSPSPFHSRPHWKRRLHTEPDSGSTPRPSVPH